MVDKLDLNTMNNYPSKQWIVSCLRNSIISPIRLKLIDAYIVGSEAKGTSKPNSDLDVALVVHAIRGKTSLQKTMQYHSKFYDDKFKPRWNGRIVDIQFFNPEDPELQNYIKIPLK